MKGSPGARPAAWPSVAAAVLATTRAIADASARLTGKLSLEQAIYSLSPANVHFQSVAKELQRLETFLRKHGVAVQSAVDIGCGDGAITIKLRDLLGVPEICGVEINKSLSDIAAARGVKVTQADMETLVSECRYDLVICYGSLHHSASADQFVRRLAALSKSYLLIVDNTVRDIPFHKLTGSRHFPLELSPYAIRSREEIARAIERSLCLIAVETFPNANIWHDRSFFLAGV